MSIFPFPTYFPTKKIRKKEEEEREEKFPKACGVRIKISLSLRSGQWSALSIFVFLVASTSGQFLGHNYQYFLPQPYSAVKIGALTKVARF